MTKGLIDWASEQPAWVSDSLRRIAIATDHTINDDDLRKILENVKNVVGVGEPLTDLVSIDASHIGAGSTENRRTILAQLGPVQNIDRLAAGQTLRMAPEGITLVYGENGSGKSGYTRIAKRLCRSLSVDQLRGNVFATDAVRPMRVAVRYRVGDDEITTLEWDPATTPPSVLRQISVFDSHNAKLYVDGDNRIAYLPRELAILEHHGDLCQRLAQSFGLEEKALSIRLKVPLPAGYAPDTAVAAMLARLDPKVQSLPTEQELRAIATLTDADRSELSLLEAELATDPVALAAVRRRGAKVLARVGEVLTELQSALSTEVGEGIAAARRNLLTASNAARLVATERFAGEPVPDVGGDVWRILYEAARSFAANDQEPKVEKLPDSPGDLCMLCLEPLSPTGAERMARFNDFVVSAATRRADDARDQLKLMLDKVTNAVVPHSDIVAASLSSYGDLDDKRAAFTLEITALVAQFESRRTCLLDETAATLTVPDVGSIIGSIADERERLEYEATNLENGASHATVLNATRARLSELKDRVKLGLELDTVLQRRQDAASLKVLTACIEQVGTRSVSTQITALRKLLVTEELERRIAAEIKSFELTHIPFKVTATSSGGQSLFSVGLQGAGRAKNNQILSEGEQRALALACFLAEIGGDDANFGIIVDDPVSSLDHIRVRKIAQRLVEEAAKGRQVIIFTHSIVFFNEVVSEAARARKPVPIIKSVVRKTQADGFGVIEENSEPWVADLNGRIVDLRQRLQELSLITDFDTDAYRRRTKDFYSDLRESWERAVEEVVLAKTVVRFVPDVMTGRLKEVCVTDEDYRIIHFAMKRASERSGHDMSAGRAIPQPTPGEMTADLKTLDDFRLDYNKRKKAVSAAREALEQPRKATLW